MGIFATVNGFAEFETAEGRNAARLEIEQHFTETQHESGKLDLETSADEPTVLAFKGDSDRVQNLAYRLSNVLQICQKHGVIDFQGPVMTESEEWSVSWSNDEEE